MEKQIQKLIETIKADYANWRGISGDKEIHKTMVADFNSGLGFKIGKKYIKIMTGNGGTPMGSVWGFVQEGRHSLPRWLGDTSTEQSKGQHCRRQFRLGAVDRPSLLATALELILQCSFRAASLN